MLRSIRWSWLALGAGAYLVFAVASLPAATAYHWLAPEALRLSGITGTAWSGRAALGSAAGLAFRDARWSLRPVALLLGRVEGDLEARLADGFVSTHAIARPGRVVLEDVQASASLMTLRGVLPPLVGDATAQLSLRLDRFVVDDGWPVNAVGTVRIGSLAVPPFAGLGGGSGLIEIGSFALEFTDTGGEGLMATVMDTSGPLELSGASLSLGLERRYMLRGRARARDGASRELVRGLEFLAPEADAEGMREFEFDGSL